MSAQAHRPAQRRGSGNGRKAATAVQNGAERDLMAGLWQEAPFPRLPADAPPEVTAYVQDIENPARVYGIHRASRRHDFQQLVDRYIHQLRYGCGSERCMAPTCFTCRRRLAGAAPIRRYNPTSARTLAVYLAGQDNPETGLCSVSKRPKEVPAAVGNLTFSVRSPAHDEETKPSVIIHQRHHRRQNPDAHGTRQHGSRDSIDKSQTDRPGVDASADEANSRRKQITASEKPVSKDYRSFAATAFGTVAFKMLEWLTPASVDALSQKVSELESESTSQTAASKPDESNSTMTKKATNNSVPAATANDAKDRPTSPPVTQPIHHGADSQQETRTKRDHPGLKKGPKATFRQPPALDTTRRKSIDSVRTVPPPEKLGRRTKSPTSIAYKPAFFENVPLHAPTADEVTVTSSDGEDSVKETAPSVPVKNTQKATEDNGHPDSDAPVDNLDEDSAAVSYPLPQTLRELNAELVDFICDVFQEDHTFETQFFGAAEISHAYPSPQTKRRQLVRHRRKRDAISRHQWKAFNEQTLFSVLSDPSTLVSSFTQDGKFFDSHSLWYCMVRLTRAAPSLVLHSLWISAGSLFASRKPSKHNYKNRKVLTAFEKQSLMSACLHALVALAPFVPDSKTLYDMSRIRSNGLALATTGASARRPADLCLQYDDVFSNALAMRLARRLFRALASQQSPRSASKGKMKADLGKTNDVLGLLLNQLDLLNTESVRILEFAQDERLLHETRVPTLLLDWARAVLLHEWDGSPVFPCNGSFHGALSFMDTLCKCHC